jgi:pimeloyl-ACP methyl ester carboxylesterase
MLLRNLCVIAIGALLCASAVGQSNENKSMKPAGPCTTKTGLYCEIYGSGDPILAVHGLGASLYSWRNLKGELPGHKLILIDLRGAGKSPKPHDKHYSIHDQANLIYEFILEQNLRNLTLIGNSYGGAVSLIVAISLCEQNPGLLSKLILIDSGGYNKLLPWYLKLMRTPVLGWLALHILSPRQAAKTVLKNAYYNHRLITKEQIAAYAEPIGSPGGRYALLQTAKGVIPKDINDIIAKYRTINVPTLILWGLNDRVIPLEIGKMLHEAIPGSRLQTINECGHVPQEEKPAETICYISEFLNIPHAPCPK